MCRVPSLGLYGYVHDCGVCVTFIPAYIPYLHQLMYIHMWVMHQLKLKLKLHSQA